jgi:hypothetical protein
MDPMMNNPVLIRWLKVAICSVALGWGVAPASADVHRYLYELSTKSGEFLYADEVPPGAKSPTKCVDVTTDRLDRVTQVVRQVNGKMTSETIYQFAADAKLPSGFETIAANGERISQNRIQRNPNGDRIRVDEFTVTGELAECVIRKVGPDSVEEITYTALGKPQGDRVENYYSPAGILVRSRCYVNSAVCYEYEYGINSGLRQSERKFRNDELDYFTKTACDASGEILREDIYSANDLWYGVWEYTDDLLRVKKYINPGGAIWEFRYSYDDDRQPKEVAFYHNEQLICIFKYDRIPTGAINRTFALGANGQVFAVYPGVEVDLVDQQGHDIDHPELGTIYRQGNWWGPTMPSFGRADGDGAMP